MLYLDVMNAGKQLADLQFCSPNTQCLITELELYLAELALHLEFQKH